MTAPHLKLKDDPTPTPMMLDLTPFLTLTMIAVLMPNAAQAAIVARRVAIDVIYILSVLVLEIYRSVLTPCATLPFRSAAIGARIITKPARPQAIGFRIKAPVVWVSTSTLGREENELGPDWYGSEVRIS